MYTKIRSHDSDTELGSSLLDESSHRTSAWQRPSLIKKIGIWSFHIFLLLLNLFAYFAWRQTMGGMEDRLLREMPHDSQLESIGYKWQTWNLTLGATTAYTALKGRGDDSVWDKITANPNSKVDGLLVPKNQLDGINKTSIVYPNGEYLALIDVFHQLHCLNHLRKIIYKDQYPEELSKEELAEAHTAHCLDSISADASLITFDWIADYPMAWPNFSTTHKCRDWDKFMAWTEKEYEHMENFSQFVTHPVLGKPNDGEPWKVPLRPEDVHYLDNEGKPIE